MREICFDTETTGLYADGGDRIIEIGALELINHIPTGKQFHEYINPQRDVPQEAIDVHGITNEFLANKPIFSEIAQKRRDFVGDDGILVAHNAEFDIKFINMELKKCGLETYSWDRVVDTLAIARKQFPGAHNNLDALCKRFNIDNSSRTLHGALLDAQLLADVYLQLMGGDEPSINFISAKAEHINNQNNIVNKIEIKERHFYLSEEENKEHISFLEKNIKNPIWLKDTNYKND
ncbi:MAG: DNA polymerase III subunit epsilon [Alphaproteobacteria bacterium]|nr:DNA polymerase III subunit epsilon [Alphaproteobacteria bacterium]